MRCQSRRGVIDCDVMKGPSVRLVASLYRCAARRAFGETRIFLGNRPRLGRSGSIRSKEIGDCPNARGGRVAEAVHMTIETFSRHSIAGRARQAPRGASPVGA